MRLLITLLVFASALVSVRAEEPAAIEEVEIPTEISEPPYEVGQLMDYRGHYIERDEGQAINFRMVENRIRVYWVDENNLVLEPEVANGNVRLRGGVRGPTYHWISTLDDDVGLGAPRAIQRPHNFNVFLTLGSGEGSETITFRYVFSLNEARDAR